jgi:hypothetical protein
MTERIGLNFNKSSSFGFFSQNKDDLSKSHNLFRAPLVLSRHSRVAMNQQEDSKMSLSPRRDRIEKMREAIELLFKEEKFHDVIHHC